jgi:acetylglutamate kinase
MVDGVRVTDPIALEAAVSVLAGTINTRLVAALSAAGVRAVGLTGVDGGTLLCDRAPGVRSALGAEVDLGEVGVPLASSGVALIEVLCGAGWVPAIASIGSTSEGRLLNVNADVAAAHLAVTLGAARLLVLGATDGVLDGSGRTLRDVSTADARALVDSGAARDGMAAKLGACARASAAGVLDVRILNGRTCDFSGGTRVLASRV